MRASRLVGAVAAMWVGECGLRVGGLAEQTPSRGSAASSPSARAQPRHLEARPGFALRGGAADSDADSETAWERLKAIHSPIDTWSTGAEQWAALGYYQENFWGGPCPEEGCRCRDPNAEPPSLPLPQNVHPSILHMFSCICPACQARRARMQDFAAARAQEEVIEAEQAERAFRDMQQAMRQGEDGSVYSLHGAYDTDTVPDAIMGSADDPLTPLGVCAMHPPRAADDLEALMQKEIAAHNMDDPRNVLLLIQYAQFLYDARGDRARAALLADKVRQVDPGHWWINVYGEKYLAALNTAEANAGIPPGPRETGPQGGAVAGGGLWVPDAGGKL